uniref:Cytochrome c-553 n=1 Tax=Trieres chinensis TaxID=1514140 RepID=A0A7S1ZXA3_TRICV|mmetsp:Transcript_34869/g.71268  ORF Transcript_34869/g.71268 Transcript_34869/m.71268 type:complete len:215 (+) Transcript_34869:3-647(+)
MTPVYPHKMPNEHKIAKLADRRSSGASGLNIRAGATERCGDPPFEKARACRAPSRAGRVPSSPCQNPSRAVLQSANMKLTVLAVAVTSVAAFQAPQAPKIDLGKAAQAGAVAGALAFGIAGPAFAGDVGAGEQVFNANCAACHAGGQNVIMPDKTLEKEALEQYLAGGRNEKAVINQVTNGKNAMPAFGGRLSDDDIANVASYVIATSESGWDE